MGSTIPRGQTTININVLDVNDNPPAFSANSFRFNLQENEPSGTFVGMVAATDRDSGINAEVSASSSMKFNVQ